MDGLATLREAHRTPRVAIIVTIHLHDLDGPLNLWATKIFLSPKKIKVFHDVFSLFKINFQHNSV